MLKIGCFADFQHGAELCNTPIAKLQGTPFIHLPVVRPQLAMSDRIDHPRYSK